MIEVSDSGHISGLHDVTCMAAGYVSPHYIYSLYHCASVSSLQESHHRTLQSDNGHGISGLALCDGIWSIHLWH